MQWMTPYKKVSLTRSARSRRSNPEEQHQFSWGSSKHLQSAALVYSQLKMAAKNRYTELLNVKVPLKFFLKYFNRHVWIIVQYHFQSLNTFNSPFPWASLNTYPSFCFKCYIVFFSYIFLLVKALKHPLYAFTFYPSPNPSNKLHFISTYPSSIFFIFLILTYT